MNRFICITLCLSLFGCVESPEERTAFKKEVEALKLATEVLPGEIARLKAELQATQKPQESALSLSILLALQHLPCLYRLYISFHQYR